MKRFAEKVINDIKQGFYTVKIDNMYGVHEIKSKYPWYKFCFNRWSSYITSDGPILSRLPNGESDIYRIDLNSEEQQFFTNLYNNEYNKELNKEAALERDYEIKKKKYQYI